MSKATKLVLADFSGGQNDRDEPNKIGEFDAQVVENLFTDQAKVETMPGAEILGGLIEHTRFESDEHTVALWHFNEVPVADVYPDSSTSAIDLTAVDYAASKATLGDGIIFNRSQLSLQYGGVAQSVSTKTVLNNALACSFEGNIVVNDSFTAVPYVVTIGATDYQVSNSGQNIFAIGNMGVYDARLGIFQDYDSASGLVTNEPYAKFVLTLTMPSGQTEVHSISSQALQRNIGLHVRGNYDSFTGMMEIFINTRKVAEKFIGQGTKLKANGYFSVGGGWTSPSGAGTRNSGAVVYDEVRVSSIARTDVPYLKPRPELMPLAKADGTRQMVVAAADSLYYTSGDGRYTKISGGFSATAQWCGRQCGDYLFLSNGIDKPQCWDGSTLFPWGEGTIPMELWQSANGSAPASGTALEMAYTFCYGEFETGLSVSTLFTNPSSNNVDIRSIPIGPANCTARKLYVKDATGTWRLWRVIGDNTTTDIGGDFAQASPPSPYFDQGAFGITDGTGATELQSYPAIESAVEFAGVPNGKYLAVNYGAMFAAGMLDEPYSVRFSIPGAPHVFQGQDIVNADSSHGPINGLAVDGAGELMVPKAGKATMVLRGSSPEGWTALETIHTSLGCIDNLAFVLHSVNMGNGGKETDRKILCFPCGDGHWYYNEGLTFIRLSDKISKTVKRLASSNGTRFEWNTTTYAQFASGLLVDGSATQNVYNPLASVDGLRAKDGSVGMMPFMTPVALWGGESGVAVPAGFDAGSKVSWICKGAQPSEYFFGVHDTGRIWHTTDEFATVTMIGVSPDDSPTLELVHGYVNISGAEVLFVFTVAGGVFRFEDPLGAAAWTVVHQGERWEADLVITNNSYWNQEFETPRRDEGGVTHLGEKKRVWGFGNFYGKRFVKDVGGVTSWYDRTDQVEIKGLNIFIEGNHKIFPHITTVTANSDRLESSLQLLSQSGITSNEDGTYLGHTPPLSVETVMRNLFRGNTSDQDPYPFIPQGFYQVRDDISEIHCALSEVSNPGTTVDGVHFGYGNHWLSHSTEGFFISHRKRQTVTSGGGTFRPQASFDGVYLVWSGNNGTFTGAEWLWSCPRLYNADTGVLQNPTITPSEGVIARCWDGAFHWETDTSEGTVDGVEGFSGRLYYRASGGRYLKARIPDRTLIQRLAFNPVDGFLYATGLYWAWGGSGTGMDTYTYNGFIAKIDRSTGAFSFVKQYPGRDAYPLEMTVDTVHGKVYCAMRNQTAGNPQLIEEVLIDGTVTSLQLPASNVSTFLERNLVFSEASGAAQSYLWPDRLLFPGDSGFPVMRGVTGAWEVRGRYTGASKDLGAFTAFDTFETAISVGGPYQTVDFELANGAALPLTDFVPIYKGTLIDLGAAPQSLSQWRANFVWANNGQTDPAPSFDFVSIGYHSGTLAIPRVCGWHWGGRSYWGIAEAGEAENSFLAVLQKNLSWVFKTGLSVDCMQEFFGNVTAICGYNLAKLDVGTLNLGDYAEPRLLTRNILDAQVDKCLLSVRANIGEFTGTVDGAFIVTPVRAGLKLADGGWKLVVPATLDEESQIQVVGTPLDRFTFSWARSLAFELSAPRAGYVRVDGVTVALPAQSQAIRLSHLTIDLRVTEPSYAIVTR